MDWPSKSQYSRSIPAWCPHKSDQNINTPAVCPPVALYHQYVVLNSQQCMNPSQGRAVSHFSYSRLRGSPEKYQQVVNCLCAVRSGRQSFLEEQTDRATLATQSLVQELSNVKDLTTVRLRLALKETVSHHYYDECWLLCIFSVSVVNIWIVVKATCAI